MSSPSRGPQRAQVSKLVSKTKALIQHSRHPMNLYLILFISILSLVGLYTPSSLCLSIESLKMDNIQSIDIQPPSIAQKPAIHQLASMNHSLRNLNGKAEEEQYQSSMYHYQDLRRPIWNLAHMVNSINELDYRLR